MIDINGFISQNLIPEIKDYLFFEEVENAIDAIVNIQKIIRKLKLKASCMISNTAAIHKSAAVSNSYIGNNVEIYEGCSVRDSIIWDNTVIGHCSEVARSIILKNCEIPRFNYVGSSLLGERVWIGGLVSCATRRHDDKNVILRLNDFFYDTKQWKFGSLVGSDAKIGYASHINPGCVIGKGSFIGPNIDLKIYVPPNSLVSLKQNIKMSTMRDLTNMRKELQ